MAEGAVLAGTGLQVIGQIEESKAQEKAALNNAEAQRQRAFEVLRRSEQNIRALKKEASQLQASQVAAFANSGVDLASGTTLLQIEETNFQLAESIAVQREEAQFRADQIFRAATLDEEQARTIKKLRPIQVGATILGGLGSAAKAKKA